MATAEGGSGSPAKPAAQARKFEPAAAATFPYSLIRHSLPCQMGYRMELLSRQTAAGTNLYDSEKSDDWALGLTIISIPYVPAGIIDLVRPKVKVYAVDIETGKYIQSVRRPACLPLSTRYVAMKSDADNPTWNCEFVLDATYRDAVSENTLLLFEIYDDKPSVSMSRSSVKKPPRRMAWGYLLPIGGFKFDRKISVGIFEEWKMGFKGSETNRNDKPNSAKKMHRPSNRDGGDPDREHAHSHEQDDEGKQSETDGLLDTVHDSWRTSNGHECDVSLRVQLYRFQRRETLLGRLQRTIMGWPDYDHRQEAQLASGIDDSYPDGVPEVYFQWRKQRRISIGGAYLQVRAGPRRMALSMGYQASITAAPYGASDGSGAPMTDPLAGVAGGGVEDKDMDNKDRIKLRAAVIRRLRSPKEPCAIPDKVLHRLNVGPQGGMIVKYSHCGHLLAVSAKSGSPTVNILNQSATSMDPSTTYALRLYDSDTGAEVWRNISAHHGVIYDIQWSEDDTYVLTCSGDGTVKVWDVMSLLAAYQRHAVGGRRTFTGGGGGGDNGTTATPSKAAVDVNGPTTDREGNEYMSAPHCVLVMVASPPVYVYTAVFQNHSNSGNKTFAAALAQASTLDSNNSNGGNVVGSQEGLHINRDPADHLRSPPRIISGSSDGKLRVWEGGALVGYIAISQTAKDEGRIPNASDEPAHYDRVQALTIDDRTKFLVSGDAAGEVLIWRCDKDGWYQFLRRFKREQSLNATLMQMSGLPTSGVKTLGGTASPLLPAGSDDISKLTTSGVMSLSMHPDKTRPQILVMSHDPSQLRVFNMSTYRMLSAAQGFSPNLDGVGFFSRAAFSADGRYAVSGIAFRESISSAGDKGPQAATSRHSKPAYALNVWDSQTGSKVPCKLADFSLPYPVRSISWHPKQHVMAVAMIGEGAAVVIYAGSKEEATRAATQINQATIAAYAAKQQQNAAEGEDTGK